MDFNQFFGKLSAVSFQRLALRARYANSCQLSAISATRTLREQLSAFSD
ncbi:MAG: hypothetical protein F6K26_55950 [Moorea sp. SIO2I5]|nr:hypothetical protein [Moorena sp. SIO2I5]